MSSIISDLSLAVFPRERILININSAKTEITIKAATTANISSVLLPVWGTGAEIRWAA